MIVTIEVSGNYMNPVIRHGKINVKWFNSGEDVEYPDDYARFLISQKLASTTKPKTLPEPVVEKSFDETQPILLKGRKKR